MTETTTDARDADEQDGFSAAERAAIKERAAELRRSRGKKKDPEADLLEKIAEMPASDAAIAHRIHELVGEHAPTLTPKTWYGMPAYAKDGKILCFFQGAAKFETRYATFGFNDVAALDDGASWPTAFAILELTPAVEERLAELLRRAVG